MKNNITKIISVFALLLFLSGCMKYNMDIKITNDKKMKIELIEAFTKNTEGDLQRSTMELSDEEIKEFEKNGWKIENYEDSDWLGFKITKSFDNIDDISTDNPDTIYDLNSLIEYGKESKYMFYKKEEDNKTTYYSKFKAVINLNNSGESENENSIELGNEEMYNALMSSMDLKLRMEVPKVIKSNATSTDGNKLTWDLTKMQKDSIIELEFELTGNSFPIIPVAIGGGIALLVIIVVVVVVSSKKKKKNLNGTISNVSVNQ